MPVKRLLNGDEGLHRGKPAYAIAGTSTLTMIILPHDPGLDLP